MKFGDWVLDIRKKQELDVRAFAEKTGVDSSTISRTEHSHTETTIYTAYRITEGMEFSISELIQNLEGKNLPWLDKRVDGSDAILTLKDVQAFINHFRTNRDNATENLTFHLNNILEVALSKGRYDEEYEKAYYTPTDIKRSLVKSPVSFQLDFKYPLRIDPDVIAFTYAQNGAIMLHDVDTYIAGIRPKIRPPYGLSSFGLRVSTGSSLERIKLSDVIHLDSDAGQDGRLIGMYWEACRFYDWFKPSEERKTRQRSLFDDENYSPFVPREEWVIRLASLYIIICRWYQTLWGPHFVWKTH
jgi:transcriptional regulator with XRE-family HTH domain